MSVMRWARFHFPGPIAIIVVWRTFKKLRQVCSGFTMKDAKLYPNYKRVNDGTGKFENPVSVILLSRSHHCDLSFPWKFCVMEHQLNQNSVSSRHALLKSFIYFSLLGSFLSVHHYCVSDVRFLDKMYLSLSLKSSVFHLFHHNSLCSIVSTSNGTLCCGPGVQLSLFLFFAPILFLFHSFSREI